MKIREKLLELSEQKYKDFQSKLVPSINKETIIGIRNPILRDIAKSYKNDDESMSFIDDLPHKYYEENMLHGILISDIKNFNDCIYKLEKFLPYVDNWAVCDSMSPKVFKKNREKLKDYAIKWSLSKEEYIIRFGIKTFMNEYLDEDFEKSYLDLVCKIKTEEYYVKMMIAWYFATALTKKWDETIEYIENKKLEKWIHNKSIQKARESLRISKERKDYLKTLKIK